MISNARAAFVISWILLANFYYPLNASNKTVYIKLCSQDIYIYITKLKISSRQYLNKVLEV
jgi:hypothetical protein